MDSLQGAEISKCNLYRFKLWRKWDDNLPNVLFLMLNPSTAGASTDDATIRRCIGYAQRWNYGGLFVGNLSPFRATDPKELKGRVLPAEITQRNIQAIIEMAAQRTQIIVCAWGNHATSELKKGLYEVWQKVDKPYFCLGKTGFGEPKHPVRLPYSISTERFDFYKATKPDENRS